MNAGTNVRDMAALIATAIPKRATPAKATVYPGPGCTREISFDDDGSWWNLATNCAAVYDVLTLLGS